MRRLLNWLSRFFAVRAVHEPEWVATGSRQPVVGGYDQFLSAELVAGASGIEIPTVASTGNPNSFTQNLAPGYAVIQNSGTAAVRWRDDGIAPTAAIGMILNPGAELDYAGDLTAIQFIAVAAGAQLEVTLYR